MEKKTARFGTINYGPEDVITFSGGLIGFPSLTSFVVIEHKPSQNFRWLQSIDDGTTALLVTDPTTFVQGYAPVICDEDATELNLDESSAVVLLTTVSIPAGKPEEMTLNLAAPLVINAESRTAKQVVLEDDAYTIKHRVFPTAHREDQAVAA